MKRCVGWSVTLLLTTSAASDTKFEVRLKSWPPHVAACQFLAAHDAGMAVMEFVENEALQLCRDDYSCAQHDASLMHRQFVAPAKKKKASTAHP